MLWAAALWCYSAMFTPCPTTMNISKGVTALPHIHNSPCFSSSPLFAPLLSHQNLFKFFPLFFSSSLITLLERVCSLFILSVSHLLHLLYAQHFVYLPDSTFFPSHSLSLSLFFPLSSLTSLLTGSWVGTHVQIHRCVRHKRCEGENTQYVTQGRVWTLKIRKTAYKLQPQCSIFKFFKVKCNNH